MAFVSLIPALACGPQQKYNLDRLTDTAKRAKSYNSGLSDEARRLILQIDNRTLAWIKHLYFKQFQSLSSWTLHCAVQDIFKNMARGKTP